MNDLVGVTGTAEESEIAVSTAASVSGTALAKLQTDAIGQWTAFDPES